MSRSPLVAPLAADFLGADRRLRDEVIVVAFGGNLGGREAVLARARDALQALSGAWGQATMSSFYASAPVGPVQEQPEFVNAVAAWRVPGACPDSALEALQRQEDAHARSRATPGGPRTLDLDLLFVGQQCRSDKALALPHQRLHQRAFVLQPLCELFGADFRWCHVPTGELVSLGTHLTLVEEQRCDRISQGWRPG